MASMNKKNVAQVSAETFKIESYLVKQKPGEEISFEEIEHQTGVVMDNKGKAYMRTALKRLKFEYAAIIGYGIKLADAETTMPLVLNKLDKVNKSVKRAEKTHKNLQEQFFNSLDVNEQKQILFIGAVFGAIKVAAENGKIVYQAKNKINSSMTINIPNFD